MNPSVTISQIHGARGGGNPGRKSDENDNLAEAKKEAFQGFSNMRFTLGNLITPPSPDKTAATSEQPSYNFQGHRNVNIGESFACYPSEPLNERGNTPPMSHQYE